MEVLSSKDSSYSPDQAGVCLKSSGCHTWQEAPRRACQTCCSHSICRAWCSADLGWYLKFAFVTSSQVILRLTQGPHFENHCLEARGLSAPATLTTLTALCDLREGIDLVLGPCANLCLAHGWLLVRSANPSLCPEATAILSHI